MYSSKLSFPSDRDIQTQKRESKGNEMMYSCAIKQPKGVSASDAKAKFEALLHQNGMAVNVGAASVSYSAGSTVSGERELGVDYLFIDVLPIAAGKGMPVSLATRPQHTRECLLGI
jgi:hypothetical protein